MEIGSKAKRNDESKWYKYVPTLQRISNSTITRSTKYNPFELMAGVKSSTVAYTYQKNSGRRIHQVHYNGTQSDEKRGEK